MSVDPSSNGAAQSPETLAEALPGLFRVAAGLWVRTGVWALETSLRVGARVARASMSPEAAAEFVDEVGSGIRSYARELLGVTDLDERVRQLSPPRRRSEDARPDPGSLRELGAALLRQSADVEADEQAHPAYARILAELAPDEGRILRRLMNEGAQPCVDVRAANLIGMGSQLIAQDLTMIGTESGCRHLDRVPAYLNNLRRLGLIAITADPLEDPMRYHVLEAQPDAVEALKRAGRAKTDHKRIAMTPFGRDFCETVLPVAAKGSLGDSTGPEDPT
jgi:abortive infection alpha-like protein